MDTSERAVSAEELLPHLGWVRKLALGLVGDPHRAEDIAQDAWLVSARQPAGRLGALLVDQARLRAWFAVLTRRLARDLALSEAGRARRERAASRPEAGPSTWEVVERNALQQRVSRAVMRLPEPYRSTILYRYLDELDSRAVAERMGVSPEAVRKRLSRGLAMLRASLADVPRRSWAWLAFPFPLRTPIGGLAMVSHTKAVVGTASACALVGAAVLYTTETRALVAPPGEPAPARELALLEPGAGATPLVGSDDREAEARRAGAGSDSSSARAPLAAPAEPGVAAPGVEGEAGETAHGMLSLSFGTAQGASCSSCHGTVSASLDGVWQLQPGGQACAGGRERANGEHTGFHPDGSKAWEGEVYGKQRVGFWRFWHENGELAAAGEYVAGKQHGAWMYHHPNGNEKESGEYLYGEREGKWQEHYADGTLRREGVWRNGKEDGVVRTWYPDGKPASELVYYHGTLDGGAVEWHENGSVRARGEYVHGKREGRWEAWDATGAIDLEIAGRWAGGERVGD